MDIEKSIKRRVRQHINAKEHDFFAIVQPGFENTAQAELKSLGVADKFTTIEGGIEFQGKIDSCYRLNLCSRTATRLLMRIAIFKADSARKIHAKALEIPWELYLSDTSTVSFHITSKKSRLYHTGLIRDELQKSISSRLNIYKRSVTYTEKRDKPWEQQIFARFEKDICHLSIDTSGAALYKRGDKTHITKAPLRETTAALILLEAGLMDHDLLIDPMCGSGTFSLEGAAISLNSLPGENRTFPYMHWPAFRDTAYKHLKNSLSAKRSGTVNILASDKDPAAIDAAESNIQLSGLSQSIALSQRDFFKTRIELDKNQKALIVLNPPYGGRLDSKDSKKIYREIGRTIHTFYKQCGYAIITPSVDHEKIMSLPYDRKIRFIHGGIKVGVIIKDI